MKIVVKPISSSIVGVDAVYWRLVEVSINFVANWAHTLWHGYNNPQLLGDPVSTFILDYDASDFPSDVSLVYDYCISLLLNHNAFSDAEVIDAELSE